MENWKNTGYVKGKHNIHPNAYHIEDQQGHLVAACPDKNIAKAVESLPELYDAACTLLELCEDGASPPGTEKFADTIKRIKKIVKRMK